VQARRPLSTILKITSKKRHPEFITFLYGTNGRETGPGTSGGTSADQSVSIVDRFIIPQAGEATKCIKQQIIKVLEALET